eukprot:TRINITY_DN32985_c0_g1_i1.p1 TRINITY_DN32985_c0_g1~~TRINITY_DN32985_c0_g1_i1.p1  ORF type:complete len:197 (-),score=47.87 TRINITY_DN32985_c0_g1_i1:89-598(-)
MAFDLKHQTQSACAIPSDDSTSVILTGGYYTQNLVTRYTDTGFVEELPPLLEGRMYHACGSYHHGETMVQVVAGGYDGGLLSSTEWLVDGSDHWTVGHPLPRALYDMAFVSTDTSLFIMGGYGGDYNARAEVYSHTGGVDGEWTMVGELPSERTNGAATMVMVPSNICQ